MVETANAERIPVTVLSGFLGSGKTTVLNRILLNPEFADTAVIVNEFGDIGIDHDLIENALDDVVLLKSGCICCSIRGDFSDTLMSLMHRSRLGLIQPFSKVLVETSGLADPTALLQVLREDSGHMSGFRLCRLIVTIDAVNGPSQILQHSEAAKQAALADHILITKADLATEDQIEAVSELAARINPVATSSTVIRGEPSPSSVFEPGSSFQGTFTGLSRLPGDRKYRIGYNHAFRSSAVTLRQPVEWEPFATFMESLVSLRGAEILRIKGIVNVRGLDRPVAIHGVHFDLYPPEVMPSWPDEDRSTRLVCIATGSRFANLQSALDHALLALGAGSEADGERECTRPN